jgi:hypothetical protein
MFTTDDLKAYCPNDNDINTFKFKWLLFKKNQNDNNNRFSKPLKIPNSMDLDERYHKQIRSYLKNIPSTL